MRAAARRAKRRAAPSALVAPSSARKAQGCKRGVDGKLRTSPQGKPLDDLNPPVISWHARCDYGIAAGAALWARACCKADAACCHPMPRASSPTCGGGGASLPRSGGTTESRRKAQLGRGNAGPFGSSWRMDGRRKRRAVTAGFPGKMAVRSGCCMKWRAQLESGDAQQTATLGNLG